MTKKQTPTFDDELLSWPMTTDVETSDEDEDPRTAAELRAELAATKRDLRRVIARLDHVEEENERLKRKVNAMVKERAQRPPPSKTRGLVLASDPPEGEVALPVAIVHGS